MEKIFKRPYIFYTLGIFIFYLILNILFSGFYETIILIFKYASSVDWFSLLISIFFSLAIGVLVAVNSVLIFIKYKERKKCLEGSSLTGVGAVGGLIVGICPLCITGILPLILSIFGVSFSFATLPFNGIEVQFFVLAILIFSYLSLEK